MLALPPTASEIGVGEPLADDMMRIVGLPSVRLGSCSVTLQPISANGFEYAAEIATACVESPPYVRSALADTATMR